MPTAVLPSLIPVFPVGTTVSVYADWHPSQGVPVGEALTSAVVGADGSLTFTTAIEAGHAYYAAAQVSGEWRYRRFIVAAAGGNGAGGGGGAISVPLILQQNEGSTDDLVRLLDEAGDFLASFDRHGRYSNMEDNSAENQGAAMVIRNHDTPPTYGITALAPFLTNEDDPLLPGETFGGMWAVDAVSLLNIAPGATAGFRFQAFEADSGIKGGGTLDDYKGFLSDFTIRDGSRVTRLRHFDAREPIEVGSGASIGDAYGLYVRPQKGGNVDVDRGWGVYQEGAEDVNHFAGLVEMPWDEVWTPAAGDWIAPFAGVSQAKFARRGGLVLVTGLIQHSGAITTLTGHQALQNIPDSFAPALPAQFYPNDPYYLVGYGSYVNSFYYFDDNGLMTVDFAPYEGGSMPTNTGGGANVSFLYFCDLPAGPGE
jgi:hypothetical protein